MDSHFWPRWSNGDQIYATTWNNQKTDKIYKTYFKEIEYQSIKDSDPQKTGNKQGQPLWLTQLSSWRVFSSCCTSLLRTQDEASRFSELKRQMRLLETNAIKVYWTNDQRRENWIQRESKIKAEGSTWVFSWILISTYVWRNI